MSVGVDDGYGRSVVGCGVFGDGVTDRGYPGSANTSGSTYQCPGFVVTRKVRGYPESADDAGDRGYHGVVGCPGLEDGGTVEEWRESVVGVTDEGYDGSS